MTAMNVAVIWPMITSESLDDDVRNSYLAGQFSSVLYRTVYFLFPVWLFQEEIGTELLSSVVDRACMIRRPFPSGPCP
jgi:hypothetical protein